MNSTTEKQNPLVSVIIPLYNKAPYIRRALDSVLAQTIEKFEIVVVGGKSSDGGEDIVKSYTDSRIHFINETGNGVSAARNQGVAVARADLIAILDADDEWLPKFLETILRLREKWPDGGVYTTSHSISSPEDSSQIINIRQKGICYGHEGPIQSIFKFATDNGGFPGCTSSVVIPRNIYMESNGFSIEYKFAEDIEFWARLALYYPWIHSFENLVIYHMDDPNSAIKNPLLRGTEHPFLQSFHTMFTQSEQQILLKSIFYLDLYLDSLNLWNARNLLYLGQKKNALIELKKITHKELQFKKMKLYLRVFIPDCLKPFGMKILKILNSMYFQRLHR